MARLQHYEMRSRSYGAHTALGQLSWRNRASPTGRDHQIYKHQGRGVEQFGFGYSHARSHALCLPFRPDRQRYAGGRVTASLHRFHPRCTATIHGVKLGLVISGVILILHKPLLWILLAIIIPMQIVRARKEAKVLEAKFGNEYREYQRRTWF